MATAEKAHEVTIKIRAFPYYKQEKDLVTDLEVRREYIARRGDTVELSEADYQRAVKFDAIIVGEVVSSDPEDELLDTVNASVAELTEWLEEDEPTEDETVAAVGDSGEAASRMIEAEKQATGGQPRKGVLSRLTKIAGS